MLDFDEMTGLVTRADLEELEDEQRRLDRVTLRLEDGEVLAEGHRPLTELERLRARAAEPARRTYMTFGMACRCYPRESVERIVRARLRRHGVVHE